MGGVDMADFLIAGDTAYAFCKDVFMQLGVGSEEASICAGGLVESSLRGVDSHGIASLPIYAERIYSGQMRPGMDLELKSEGPVVALCDGQHGLGPVLARRAADLAMGKAAISGMGAVSLFNGNYVGALAPYVVRVAEQGMLGICAANSTPRVAPHGGSEGLHGTNPLAYAVPMQGQEPLVFDAATGHSAARVVAAREDGNLLPSGVLVDATGHPSTDPQDLHGGALLPVGGALGYGIGLLVDLLCGGLNGGPCGVDVPPVSNIDAPYGCGFFVLAIDAAHLGGRDVLAERCAFLAQSARNVRTAEGVNQVRVPGERALEERRVRLERGIPCTSKRWQVVLERLRACAVDVEHWQQESLA
jgi:LDH2 family malate/lactate/ureidoglycolate dehydrogenase